MRTTVIPNRRKVALQAEVKKHVEAGAALYTDALLSYEGLEGDYAHQVIDHAGKYVDGKIHSFKHIGSCEEEEAYTGR